MDVPWKLLNRCVCRIIRVFTQRRQRREIKPAIIDVKNDNTTQKKTVKKKKTCWRLTKANLKRSILLLVLGVGLIDMSFIFILKTYYGALDKVPEEQNAEEISKIHNLLRKTDRPISKFNVNDLNEGSLQQMLAASGHIAGNKDTNITNCEICLLYNMTLVKTDDFPCSRMKISKRQIPVCYKTTSNSASIWDFFKFRNDRNALPELEPFLDILDWNPFLSLIDVGAGVGAWSLLAASMGRRVMAIEPCEEALKRLKMAAYMQGTISQFTLVQNAVGAIRGMTYRQLDGPDMGCNSAQYITLDDIRHVSRNKAKIKEAILRINTKGFEPKLFKRAEELFKEIDISLVILDWSFLKKFCEKAYLKELKPMFDFFLKQRFIPLDYVSKCTLDYKNCRAWPKYVIWARERVKQTEDVFL